MTTPTRREAAGLFVPTVGGKPVVVTRSCSLAVVPALSFTLVARRHVDYGRTRSMICMSA
jgi:hypothetical protein